MNQHDAPQLTVVIATRNRAKILGETLQSMTRLDLQDISAEFVVVDNDSSDNTKEVIESFRDRLPIRYVFEPLAGQNHARNRALADVQLGRLVVFTDDDVAPRADWLRAVLSTSNRWPNHSVFGGKIHPIWPSANIPKWTSVKSVQGLCFGWHNHGEAERLYPPDKRPFSANLWVRREVFDTGRRFDAAIGPKPGSYVVGSETSFLTQLAREGYAIVYSPHAVVGHRIQPWQISIRNALKRAFRAGRGLAHFEPLPRYGLWEKRPLLWYLLRGVAVGRSLCRLAGALLSLSVEKRVAESGRALTSLGRNIESVRVAMNTQKAAARQMKDRSMAGPEV